MSTGTILAARAARQREEWHHSLTTTVAEAAGQPVKRIRSRLTWFDHMLGGGFVRGSVVMVHGEPGAGKSTALIQATAGIQNSLYVSAEEELSAVADRAIRLKLRRDLGLLASNDMPNALAIIGTLPFAVIDSIQQMGGRPEDVVAMAVAHARKNSVCLVLVCHETKTGKFRGASTLEHLIDCSIKISRGPPRSITTDKNRFGPAGISLFLEMTDTGLVVK